MQAASRRSFPTLAGSSGANNPGDTYTYSLIAKDGCPGALSTDLVLNPTFQERPKKTALSSAFFAPLGGLCVKGRKERKGKLLCFK